jgi:uncharacterized protein (TIGR02246 family)
MPPVDEARALTRRGADTSALLRASGRLPILGRRCRGPSKAQAGDEIRRTLAWLPKAAVGDTQPTMPEESMTLDLVELMGRAFEAANRRDLDAVASSFAEDATFDGRALGDHFEGRAAIRSFLEDWFGAYEELEVGLEEVRDLGNGIVFAVVVQSGRPAGGAGHLRQREGWVFVWVRGLIARLTISEVDEARAAAERLAQERG